MATTTKKKKPGSRAGSKATTGTRTGKKKAPKAEKLTLRKVGGKYPYDSKKERQKWEEAGYTIPKRVSLAAGYVARGKKGNGGILNKEGKAAKRSRMAAGALAGTKSTRRKKTGAVVRDPDFQPTASQKRNLPPKMLKGLVKYHQGR